MQRTTILRAVIGLLIVSGLVLVLCAPGCNSQEELQLSQRQNQKLKKRVEDLEKRFLLSQNRNKMDEQRVAELETRLRQAMVQPQQAAESVPTATTATETVTAGSIYEVVEGESLWTIAEEQLGEGIHYKEILALNPRIKKQDSLALGMRLNLPTIEGLRT